MQIEHNRVAYEMTRASDLQRDGMSLELSQGGQALAEVFYSDLTGQFSISVFASAVPLELIEQLIVTARKSLPPAS